MSSEIALSAHNVSKRYTLYSSGWQRMIGLLLGRDLAAPRTVNALQDINLQIRRGETLAIIGRNGSGKSTLLQILCGILQPSTGHVTGHGRIAALLELGAGFSPEFTGRENIYMGAAVYGLSRQQIDQRLPAILDFAEIGTFIDQPVKTYSSGMYVRLAFSLIAHVDADILVIDEALAVGDAYFTQKCARFLRSFKQHGTLVFVSHDTHSVMSLCDRAVWLDKGHIQMVGPARPVCETYIASLYVQELDKAGGGIKAQGEFGTGQAKITACRLLDASGKELHLLDHAQQVTLEVTCTAEHDIPQPIFGFFLRDRLGQPLLGDNSLNCNADWPLLPGGNQPNRLQFSFALPLLATGDYTIGVAISSGTQEKHQHHHWIYEAYAFKSQANPRLTGAQQLENMHFTATPS